MMNKDILYIWLSDIKGIGPAIVNKLVNYFGKIENVCKSTYNDLVEIDGIGPKIANNIIENKELEQSKIIYEKCNKLNISIVNRESDSYPIQLRENMKAPPVLYVRVILKPIENAIAIVGSRRCSDYGKEIILELATALSNNNIHIISGMPKEIDSYAHTVAIKNNTYTIAVLGTGVDKCYPSEHISLMNRIIE